MDKRPVNFSQKGFSRNFLSFMKLLEKNDLCCLDFLTEVVTENSSSVIFSGLGTTSSPLTATVTGGLTANDGITIDPGVIKLGQSLSQAGNPGQLTEPREVPLNGQYIQFTPLTGANTEGLHCDYISGVSNPTWPAYMHFNADSGFNSINFEFPQGNIKFADLAGYGFWQGQNFPNGMFLSMYPTGNIGVGVTAGSLIQFGFGTLFANGIAYTADNVGGIAKNRLGDGTTPTALVHIKAASGVANCGSLKIDSGTLVSTPEHGLIETDGTHLYWTDNAGTRHTIV